MPNLHDMIETDEDEHCPYCGGMLVERIGEPATVRCIDCGRTITDADQPPDESPGRDETGETR